MARVGDVFAQLRVFDVDEVISFAAMGVVDQVFRRPIGGADHIAALQRVKCFFGGSRSGPFAKGCGDTVGRLLALDVGGVLELGILELVSQSKRCQQFPQLRETGDTQHRDYQRDGAANPAPDLLRQIAYLVSFRVDVARYRAFRTLCAGVVNRNVDELPAARSVTVVKRRRDRHWRVLSGNGVAVPALRHEGRRIPFASFLLAVADAIGRALRSS